MSLTPQQAFDLALNGIRGQGYRQSVHDESGDDAHTEEDLQGLCMYRGPDGLKCGVGHMIPDEMYHPVIEGLGVHNLRGWAEALPILEHLEPANLQIDDHSLLIDIQAAHDGALTNGPQGQPVPVGILAWEAKMEQVAKTYSLVYTPPPPVKEES